MVRLTALIFLSSAAVLNAFSAVSRRSMTPKSPFALSSALRHHEQRDFDEISTMMPSKESIMPTRREALARTAASLLVGTSFLSIGPLQTLAADDTANGMVSQNKLAALLKQIPTFAIVDPKGVPFFVVGEDAKLTSYFFTNYGEAKRILDLANSSSDKAIRETKKEIKAKNGGVLTKQDEEEIGTNPWKNARITSVPLDLAVSLASKGKLAGAYFRLAPSVSDIEAALELDGTDDLPEGKVPLFYVDGMTISDEVSPLYFQKDQLEREWQRQSKDKPDIKVTELFATITEMVRPGGTDEELKTLQFVAPMDSKSKAEKCLKGEKEPFKLGERLIVL
mmetsp:Transcript_28082/g.59286  ORF Transcript_28082/g.59286 Transcript_28082/m.59286 type:complete len:337 (-) Transcript_28082:127-1137(-)